MNDKFTNTPNENLDIDRLLNEVSEQTNVNPHFATELEQRLREKHQPKTSWSFPAFGQLAQSVGWVALIIAFGFLMNWVIRSIAPNPLPAGQDTQTPITQQIASPTPPENPTPVTNGREGYDWRGTKLFLSVPLPDSPAEAHIYLLKDEQPATLDSARALAGQFGLQGEVYVSQGLYPAETSYFFTDGKQSLTANSNRYFDYTADMAKAFNNGGTATSPNAETTIEDFLQSHGFTFPHRIVEGDLYGGYIVEPLSPDSFPMRYEFFSSRPMRVTLDENGQIMRLEANLIEYESVDTQPYGIISAQEAFQKMMDDSITAGKIESAISSSLDPIKEWRYTYPVNETITIYGYAYSTPALDSSKPAFNQIDGYTAIGNTNGFEALEPNTFIQATGQFVTENGINKFKIESWKASDYMQDGLVGTLTRENGQILFQTDQGEQLIIQPDVPSDLPLPYENAFVLGIRKNGNIYAWTMIDDRMNNNGGGGGGGGGGQGFYKLNLSGTPVPIPTAIPIPSSVGGNYTVREGDTLTAIAQTYGVTVEELMQANGIAEPGIIIIGQQLTISGVEVTQSDLGQKIEGQRGTLNITIYNQADGTQRAEYLLSYTTVDAPYPAMLMLEGDNLQDLQAYQNMPVDIWGTVERYDQRYDIPVVKVERYEIPFPDLQFQILQGTQKIVTANGQPATLFTTNEGIGYIQTYGGSILDSSLLGVAGDQVILEALIIPGESIDGYPVLHVFSSAMAVSPKNGQPVELTITANQIYTVDESLNLEENYVPPTLTIEKVELMYYVTNPHWQVDHLDGSPLCIQPVWRFYGHYESGGEFEVIVQALKEQYLLPELAPYIPGG